LVGEKRKEKSEKRKEKREKRKEEKREGFDCAHQKKRKVKRFSG
jgi:hypothetical protein